MDIVADILLTSGAMAACFYCFVLSRRLKRFTDLDKGVGGAIAVLSVQVDDLTHALKKAENVSAKTSERLSSQSHSALEIANRLELLIATMHDLPQPEPQAKPVDPLFTRTTPMKQRAEVK